MDNKKYLLVTFAVLGLALAPSLTFGQVVYGQPPSASVRFIYNSWSTEINGVDTTLTQFMTPLSGFVPVRDNFDMSFYVANSSNNLSTPEGDYDLNGLGDVRLQARHSFAEDRLMVALGLSLPTGKKDLTLDEEWHVLQGLSRNYTEYPMRRFGEGFGFSLLFGGATMAAENVRVGGGVSYQYVGEYAPYSEYLDYNPGDIISLNALGEIRREPWTFMLDLVYSYYTSDQVEGIDIFTQSPQFDVRLGANRAGEMIGYGASVRYLARGENKLYDPVFGQEITSLKLYGDEFRAAGYLSWTVAQFWYVVPGADIRVIAGNDVDLDGSTVVGFGAQLGRSITEKINLEGGFKLYTGSATLFNPFDPTEAETDADISGYQLTLGLTAAL